MTARLPALPAILALLIAVPAAAEEPGHMKPTAEMFAVPEVRPAEGFQEEGVEAVYYKGMPWKGKQTEVFAWIGKPALEAGEKAPGVVLVHGGGGTAFASWVKLWTSRGYAAIAMDTCGTTPRGEYGKWERHEAGGPPGNNFTVANDAPEDQWPYHAVADVLLAHSLLRSLPEVDADRVGLTGVSWGGYLTCIASGLDPRFRFAAPVYGCGFLGDDSVWKAEIDGLGETGRRWLSLWDPSLYLPLEPMPRLWVTGTNDFAYPLNSLQKSYRAAQGTSTLAVRLRMPHGHGPAGEGPEEIRVFADSILKGGPALARVQAPRLAEGRIEADFEIDPAAAPLVRGELLYTRQDGSWPDRLWESADAELDATARRVSAKLPEGTCVAFLNLYDDQGCVVSCEHVEIEVE